jgi:5'-methylthioadenosine phosphorylase
LGTRAESFFLRDSAKCDLVGMTNVPEVFLAREAQMAYCTICLVTDFDCWMDDPAQHVSVEKFFTTYQGAMTNAKAILPELLRVPFTDTPVEVREALAGSVLTADEALTDSQKHWLEVLRA